MKFNKSKCWVLHLGQRNTRREYKLGEDCLANSPAERDVGVLADSRLSVSQPRGQTSAPRGASHTAQADGQWRGTSRGVQHCVA